jgi:MFS family permease
MFTSASASSSPVTVRRDLFSSVCDAGAYSVMVGMAENYFGAYALALGLGSAGAGLMVTLPVLLGSLLQLATPWGVRKIGSHKLWIVAAIFLQVACLLAMPLAGLARLASNHALAAVIAFAAATVYWATQFSAGGPWNTWMEELVPLRIRTRFFACRQRTSQICLLSGFVIGGLALQFGRRIGHELLVFTAIFLVAAICRLASGCFMARQSEPSRGKVQEAGVSLSQIFGRGGSRYGGNILIYLLAMQVAVQISGPYFTPFMLKQQQWSYVTYMLLIGISFLGKVLALPAWGRVGQRVGANGLMWIGGLAIVPLAGLWLLSDLVSDRSLHVAGFEIPGPVICIGCIQLLSGINWAAYELAMALIFLHGIPREQRTSLLTLYHFGNSAAMVVGAVISLSVFQFLGEGHETYMTIFVLSSVMRFCMVPLLARVREPAPAVAHIAPGEATVAVAEAEAAAAA